MALKAECKVFHTVLGSLSHPCVHMYIEGFASSSPTLSSVYMYIRQCTYLHRLSFRVSAYYGRVRMARVSAPLHS